MLEDEPSQMKMGRRLLGASNTVEEVQGREI